MDNGLHHHEVRKRLYENLEPYPHPVPLKRFFDRLMYVAALAAPLVLLPQVLTLYQSKDASGLSLVTWSFLTLINALWVMYGAIHKERLIMTSAFLICMIDIVIVTGILLYR
ncbi:MAG TPA: hypothetical protein VM103_01455 [Candidatus Paceibacterota bacterium]|nr:hypothetical protein [Candidatus Paceibacterota bacterium]